MRKIIHPGHLKRRIGGQISFCLALFLVSLQPVGGATFRAPAAAVPVQGKVMVVGILSFQDETDSGAPSDLGKKIALQLQQRFSLGFKDVLPKSLSQNSEGAATAALTVEQLVALGKQNAVQFVIRGGMLTLAVADSNITAQLYAEIIAVESGAVSVVRAEGTATGGSFQWSEIDLNAASFSGSAPGIALAAATESLATSIHQALLAPLVAASAGESSGGGAGTVEPTPTADAVAADADEELRQLIAQAEEIVASGRGDTDRLKSISSALEKLKAALVSKASLIEGGADATGSDQEIAAAKTEMQAALTALNEQSASAAANSAEGTPPTGEAKGLLGAIDKRASEALGLLQKIQELRSAFRTAKEDPNGAMSDGSTGEASEQATEGVSGIVMQAGQPLAGVAVTIEGSGVTAVTGPDGSYTLKALPAGKLATLVLKQNGKQLASGKIDLLRGRAAVADFDVKSNMAPAASALRIIPSTIVLKGNPRTGATGTLKGTARDQAGKPVTRGLLRIFGMRPGTGDQALPYLPIALTKNEALAAARTDSEGRYTFLNVPAGDYLVTVQKSGLQPISTRVTVKPNVATEAQSRLTAVPRSPAPDRQRAMVRGTSSAPAPAAGGVNPIVISRDRALGAGGATSASQPSGGALRGQVVDGLNRRPIAGATVLIAGRRAQTDQTGNFALADLAPGNYLAKVTSAGFSDDQQSITIRAGTTSREDFALKRLEDSNRTARVVPETPRVATAIRLGQVRGRVVDAANGTPIVGAVVAVSGGHSVVTGRDGSYNLSALPPGSYQVSVSRTGFAEKRTTLTIRAGEVTDASFRLTAIVRKPTR